MIFTPIQKTVPETPTVVERAQFEERILLIGQHALLKGETLNKVKSTKHKEYTLFSIFCEYIFIRAYDKYITIHVAVNTDPYEMKSILYKDINYEMADLPFLSQLLHN